MKLRLLEPLRELRCGRFDPVRPEAGHVQRGHHASWLAEIVPSDAGYFQHCELVGSKREHLMRKIYFFQTAVQFIHRLGLGRSAEERSQANECAIKFRDRALDDIEECLHRGHHDEAVPQATAQLEDLG